MNSRLFALPSTPDFFLLAWGITPCWSLSCFLNSKFCFLPPLPVRYSRLCSIEPDRFCPRGGGFLLYCLLAQALTHTRAHPLRPHPPTPSAGSSSRIDRVQELLGRPSSSQSQSGEPGPKLCVLCVCLCLPCHSWQLPSPSPPPHSCLMFSCVHPIQLPGCSIPASILRPRVALRFRHPPVARAQLVPQQWMAELAMPCPALPCPAPAMQSHALMARDAHIRESGSSCLFGRRLGQPVGLSSAPLASAGWGRPPARV